MVAVKQSLSVALVDIPNVSYLQVSELKLAEPYMLRYVRRLKKYSYNEWCKTPNHITGHSYPQRAEAFIVDYGCSSCWRGQLAQYPSFNMPVTHTLRNGLVGVTKNIWLRDFGWVFGWDDQMFGWDNQTLGCCS
jgi:hypothetical protein